MLFRSVSFGIVHITFNNICFNTKSQTLIFSQKSLNYLTIFSLSLLLIVYFDAYSFNERVNVTRSVHDFIHKADAPLVTSKRLPKSLEFMVWDTLYGDLYMPENLRDLTNFLKQKPENFFLIGDSSILYGITGKPSTNPALWFHFGLAIPEPDTKEFDEYENQIIENLAKYNVRFIVLEIGRAHV